MTNLAPIINQPLIYINGLQISYTNTVSMTVQPGQCRDSTNTFDIFINSATVLNLAANGLNGLDKGSLANSTTLYIYAISDPTGLKPTGLIASLSATPFLPAGYGLIRRIGWALIDGSAHIQKFYQTGSGAERQYWYDASINVLTAGTAATFTTISLAGAIPPLDNAPVVLKASFTPGSDGNYCAFRPTGSTVLTDQLVPSLSGVVATRAQLAEITVLSKLANGVPSMDYHNNGMADSLSLWVTSYYDFV